MLDTDRALGYRPGMDTTTRLHPVTVQIPEDLRRWLRVAAAERDVSQSELIASLLLRERAKRERAK